MGSFEFVFSLLSIILGLGVAEVLGGLARISKRRPRVRIGWPLGLLATWTMTETVLFWRIAWRARFAMPDTSAPLFVGFAITALYYFAGASVFPDALDAHESLDAHFLAEKNKVIGALLAAVTLAYGTRPLIMGAASWTWMAWYDWATLAALYVGGLTAMATRRRWLVIGCLILLVGLDLMDPVEAVFWPD